MLSARLIAICGWILVLLGAALSGWVEKDLGMPWWVVGIGFQFWAGYIHFFHGGVINLSRSL